MIIVRQFQNTDIEKGLIEVYRQVWSITDITEKTLQSFLSNSNYLFVAELDGLIVGTLTLHLQKKLIRDGGICGLIEDVAVLEEKRGKGIGKELVKAALAEAKIKGCYKVILSCYPEREAFYKRCGFYNESITMRHDLN